MLEEEQKAPRGFSIRQGELKRPGDTFFIEDREVTVQCYLFHVFSNEKMWPQKTFYFLMAFSLINKSSICRIPLYTSCYIVFKK